MSARAERNAPPHSGRSPASRGDTRPAGGSRWEWVLAALSTLLVGGMIVFLLTEAGEPETPPLITLRAESVIPSPGGYLLQVRAVNRGHRTAAAVRIVGVLEEGGAEVETSEVTLDFVPGESWAPATLVFRRDPRRYRLELRPTGFTDP